MVLDEILPEAQSLSRLDKIRLVQVLAEELERDEKGLIEPGRSYPICSPDRAFSAAAAMMQALDAPRVPGLHADAIQVTPDFDAPLLEECVSELSSVACLPSAQQFG